MGLEIDWGINISQIIGWFFVVGALFMAIVLVAMIVKILTLRDDIPSPSYPVPKNWKREYENKNLDLHDYVDYEGATYQIFSEQQALEVSRFENQEREALTQYWADIEAKEREARRQQKLARELAAAWAEAEVRKISLVFGEEHWLSDLAATFRIPETFEAWQELADIVYLVVSTANSEFSGRMAIKPTWQLFQEDKSLPYWARKRFFFERLSRILGRYGFLVGTVGRSGRQIADGSIVYLKSLTSEAKMSCATLEMSRNHELEIMG